MRQKNKNKFHKVLRNHIKEYGLKQVEMARILGISRMTLHRWLRGSNKPGKKAREGLAKEFGIMVEDGYAEIVDGGYELSRWLAGK